MLLIRLGLVVRTKSAPPMAGSWRQPDHYLSLSDIIKDWKRGFFVQLLAPVPVRARACNLHAKEAIARVAQAGHNETAFVQAFIH